MNAKYSQVALPIVTSILCITPLSASAFGNKGHQSVGAIAAELLQGTPAEQHVNALLNGDSLANAATWADRAKTPPANDVEMHTFIAAHPDHKKYHYTDIPFQESQYRATSVGAATNDLIHAMQNCIAVLRSPDPNISQPFNKRIALMLLAHYVGDMHQPLHVGAAYLSSKPRFVNANTYQGHYEEDLGGNYLKFGSSVLHAYWDDNTVDRSFTKVGASSPQDFALIVLQSPPVVPLTSGDVADWPKKWADEMLPVATQAHLGFKINKPVTVTDHFGTHLQWIVTQPSASSYRDSARDAIHERLIVAGHRLAQILMVIWP